MAISHATQSRSAAGSGRLGELFENSYSELRALASARLRCRSSSNSLETTALVHETFVRLAQCGRSLQVEDRAHFFRYVGRVMRAVIVDTVREARAARRGHGAEAVPFSTEIGASRLGEEQEILHVHEALESLAQCEPRLVDIVQLRYFAGLTECEIARALGITDRTVRRDWEKARLLLSEVL